MTDQPDEVLHVVDQETPPEALVELRRMMGTGRTVVCLGRPPTGDDWRRLGDVADVRRVPDGYHQQRRLYPLIAGSAPLLCWSVSAARIVAPMKRGRGLAGLRLTAVPTGEDAAAVRDLAATDGLRVAACDEAVARAMRVAGIGPPVVIAPPAAAIARSDPRNAQVRRRLGFGPEHILVYAPGRSHRRSGHRIVIWAAAILTVAEFPARTVIPNAGAGARADADFAREAGFDFLIALSGAEATEEELLAASDVAALVGRDAVPAVHLAAALAAGLPVVAADIPAAREVLADGDNALLVDPSSPRAVAQALMRLIEHPDLAGRLSDAARALAAERFDPAGVNAAWARLWSPAGSALDARPVG